MDDNNLFAEENAKPVLDRRAMWDEASVAGLVLGGVVLGATVLGELLNLAKGQGAVVVFATNFLGMVVWAAKVGLCFYFLKRFMKKVCDTYQEPSRLMSYRFGRTACVLSALVCAALQAAHTMLFPDRYAEAMAEAAKMMEGVQGMAVDEATLAMATSPAMQFTATFVYCFIYGIVLSLFLSRRIPGPEADKKFLEKFNNRYNP